MTSFAIGSSNFKKIRQSFNQSVYLDKTPFIHEIFSDNSEGFLFTRPIRFMKSTNLEMMYTFCDIQESEENSPLFDGLKIKDSSRTDYAQTWEQHFGQYPVILLSFKDVSTEDWTELFQSLKWQITQLYHQHRYLLESKHLLPADKKKINQILSGEGDITTYKESLRFLSERLSEHYTQETGKKRSVIILIDEYDTPLHYAHVYDKRHPGSTCFQSALTFMRSFFQAGLKDNKTLYKGIMTGVLRTAFGSFVSSLNNITVYSILEESPQFASYFGVTEEDIDFLMTTLTIEEEKSRIMREILREYYNGYTIAGVTLYNPWSIMNYFIRYVGSDGKVIGGRPYWLQVGSSGIIGIYLREYYNQIYTDLNHLLTMKPLRVFLDERTTFTDNDDQNIAGFWGLLVQSGYLTVSKIHNNLHLLVDCEVRIPNQEVYGAYTYQMEQFLVSLSPKTMYTTNQRFMTSLLNLDFEHFTQYLQEYLTQVVSFFDLQTEIIFHVLVMGIIAGLHQVQYLVSSNRESGSGRHDLMLLPCSEDRPGIIFEFKKADNPADLEICTQQALQQIKDKNYARGFDAYGTPSGLHIGLAFCGKEIRLDYEYVKYNPVAPFRVRESIADLMAR